MFFMEFRAFCFMASSISFDDEASFKTVPLGCTIAIAELDCSGFVSFVVASLLFKLVKRKIRAIVVNRPTKIKKLS